MINLTGVAVNIFGALVFSFIFWKKLKDDFSSDVIFTSVFYLIIGILIGLIASLTINPHIWFWASFTGVLFGTILSYYRYRLKLYETIEAVVIGMLPWITIVMIYEFFRTNEKGLLAYAIATLIFIGLYLVLDKHYKKFSWYKSGRVGFSGLATSGLFFSARAIVALVFPSMLSFLGKNDAIISGITAFAFFTLLFNLSQKTTY